MNVVALLEQHLCEVGAILSGDTRYQRGLRHFAEAYRDRLVDLLGAAPSVPRLTRLRCQT